MEEQYEKEIVIETDFLKKNEQCANDIENLFKANQINAYDIMGSIGAGKTSLIIELVKKLKDKHNIYAIAGDLTTDIDAERIKEAGADVKQINTGKECHLDTTTIKNTLQDINLKEIDILFVENVGNLICPADYRLGTKKRIVVIAITEGPYMVLKHPYTFLSADIVVINKIDLSPYVGVEPDDLEKDLHKVNPKATVFQCSCRNREGIDALLKELLPEFRY